MDFLQDEDFFGANVDFLLESFDLLPVAIGKDEPFPLDNDMQEMKKPTKKDLHCVVCGAKAFGYNFNQITCESCKAFFRRNALKNRVDFHCRFNGDCKITVENRRHCAECRIRKCFAVGMKKEWIRSEEEKHAKRLRLQMNRKSEQVSLVKQPSQSPVQVHLDPTQQMLLNNITNCYEEYTGERSIRAYSPPKELLSLRLHDFYNRKKPIIVNFVNYFSHIPEFQRLHVDDQVLLIKQNIHFLLPLNYALLKTPSHSQFRHTYVKTIGCVNNTNLHPMYQNLSNAFVSFVASDALIVKLLVIVLFFTTNPQSSDIDSIEYKQTTFIRQTQSTYTELLWLYMSSKYGEDQARRLFVNLIAKFLQVQATMNQIDQIIRMNSDVQYLDELMKTVLQLT